MRRPRKFQAGGWVSPGMPFRMQRTDQGQDFEIPRGRHVIAPGHGVCIAHLHDAPFPNGFGSPYAVVRIDSGRFAIEDRLWYLGHANADVVPVGHRFHTGDRLARLDNGLNAGWGWIELGRAAGGYPGPNGTGARYHHLFRPLWRLA